MGAYADARHAGASAYDPLLRIDLRTVISAPLGGGSCKARYPTGCMSAATRLASAGSRSALCGLMRCLTSMTIRCASGSSAAEARERRAILKPLFEVGRPGAASLRIDKVGFRHGPGRFEEILDADKVILRETVQRRRLDRSASREARAEHDSFLRGDAHALPEDRVEPADGIAERNQGGRETLKPVEMPSDARGHIVARDFADLFCVR